MANNPDFEVGYNDGLKGAKIRSPHNKHYMHGYIKGR